MKMKSLVDFINDGQTYNSEYIKEPGLSIYVRKPISFMHSADVVIANVTSKKPSKGVFTKFLDEFEPKYNFLFENVLNDRFMQYLIKRGYRVINEYEPLAPPSLIYNSCWHKRDEI